MNQKNSPEDTAASADAAASGKSHRRSAAIKLDAEIGIEDAAALHQTLKQQVGEPGEVHLDAAEVQRIHTAALQLFCLFCHDRRSAGRETRWLKPSAALRSAAALLGATTLLSLGTT